MLISDEGISVLSPKLLVVFVWESWNTGEYGLLYLKLSNLCYFLSVLTLKINGIRILWRKEFEIFIWSWFKTYPRLTGTQARARYFGAKTFAKILKLYKEWRGQVKKSTHQESSQSLFPLLIKLIQVKTRGRCNSWRIWRFECRGKRVSQQYTCVHYTWGTKGNVASISGQ